MNYSDWLPTVFPEITNDPLWRMEIYRLSVFLGEVAWIDSGKLIKDPRMLKLSDQLYSAVGSVSANIAEGYSKASKKDQARFYEYSLGSAREARDWYFKARHVLGNEVALHRIRLLVQIIRTLLKLVPEFRGKKLAEEQAEYLPSLLNPSLKTFLFRSKQVDMEHATRNIFSSNHILETTYETPHPHPPHQLASL